MHNTSEASFCGLFTGSVKRLPGVVCCQQGDVHEVCTWITSVADALETLPIEARAGEQVRVVQGSVDVSADIARRPAASRMHQCLETTTATQTTFYIIDCNQGAHSKRHPTVEGLEALATKLGVSRHTKWRQLRCPAFVISDEWNSS